MATLPAFTACYKKYSLIFKKPAGTSRGYLYTQDNFFLRLASREDPTCFGLGECGPLAGLSLDDRPDFEAHLANVCAALNRGHPLTELDLGDFPALAFGLETALLDLQHRGQRKLFDTPFSRGETSLPIHGLIWMADHAGLLEQIARKVAQGFRCLKLKVGALDFEEECAVLATIRQAYPPDQIEIRLDANGAFTPESAPAKLAGVAPYAIHSIEQPLKPGQWSALADLCANSPIHIALDEELIGLKTKAEKQALLETVKPQYIVLKPTLIGGFASGEEWLELAEGLGIGWRINSALESNIGLNAIAQWTSSLHTTLVQGLGSGQLYTNNIPSPLKLAGTGLVYDKQTEWDVSRVVD